MVGLEVVAFDVEPDSLCDYDYLTVNGVKYCGTSGPQGVVPEDGVIEWTSDDGVVRSGWKARTDGSLSPRLLTISTHVSNPFRSAGRHGRQPSQGVDLPSPGAGVGMNQCDMGKDATGFVIRTTPQVLAQPGGRCFPACQCGYIRLTCY